MMNARRGVAIGDPVPIGGRFTILWTTDGGVTWARDSTNAPIAIPLSETCLNGSVAAVDTTHVWFGTTAGKVIRTTNGGATWSLSSVFASTMLVTSVWFSDTENGIAATNNGLAARSTDGGATWTPVNVLGTGSIIGLAGVSASVEFWAVRLGFINYTSNHGTSWTTSPPNGYSLLGSVRWISMATIGANVFGWASSNLGLLRYRRITTAVDEIENPIPVEFSLEQNYPNPFNASTKIKYSLPFQSSNFVKGRVGEGSIVTLKVYDVLGREIATLVDEELKPGTYKATWNAGGFSSGVYLCKLDVIPGSRSTAFSAARKMLLLR